MRGLQALGIPTESYGHLLTSILVNKLSSEISFIISQELTDDKWNLDGVMRVVDRETDARECAPASNPINVLRKAQP